MQPRAAPGPGAAPGAQCTVMPRGPSLGPHSRSGPGPAGGLPSALRAALPPFLPAAGLWGGAASGAGGGDVEDQDTNLFLLNWLCLCDAPRMAEQLTPEGFGGSTQQGVRVTQNTKNSALHMQKCTETQATGCGLFQYTKNHRGPVLGLVTVQPAFQAPSHRE